jgi:branched-chain amino acid transport system substrate-binding protein
LVYFGGYHPEAGLIVRQMRAQNVKTVLMGADSMVTGRVLVHNGTGGRGNAADIRSRSAVNPANTNLVQYFRGQRYEPEAYTLYTYAAIQAWAQAVALARSTDMAKVSAALKPTHSTQ